MVWQVSHLRRISFGSSGNSPLISSRVVHGHTPEAETDVRPNRIGIDTGAVFTGNLTCLVLQGVERALLGADGIEPLAEAGG